MSRVRFYTRGTVMNEEELLKQLAKDVRLAVPDEDMPSLLQVYHTFLEQVACLEKIQTEGVEPLVFPFDIEIHELREDDVQEVFDVQDVLKNAKNTKENQILVFKVVE